MKISATTTVMTRTHILIGLCALLTTATANAQDDNATEKKKIINLQRVDRDYAIQGEYSGQVDLGEGQIKKGVQVIAIGNGKFNATAYSGGLPGDGFDGESIKHYSGKRDGEQVIFDADGATGVIHEGTLSITDGGKKVFGAFAKVDRESSTLGMKPPQGALALFDGTNVDQWKKGKLSADGFLMQGATSKKRFQDHQLHIEFLLPYCPHDKGQARGNSGLYMQGRYEVQMLDSFGRKTETDECGGIYKTKVPDVNMCFPPLRWQTYDIDFTAASFDDDGKMKTKPRISVKHNGIVIHEDVELPKSTTASPLKPGSEPGPIFLQNHKNPVRFRNIWVVEK